jgi:hypothetical protein
MNEARRKTCTRNPSLRLLFVGIASSRRNLWVVSRQEPREKRALTSPELRRYIIVLPNRPRKDVPLPCSLKTPAEIEKKHDPQIVSKKT